MLVTLVCPPESNGPPESKDSSQVFPKQQTNWTKRIVNLIVSITSILIGSTRSYLARNWHAIT